MTAMKCEALEEAHSRPRGVGIGDHVRKLWVTEVLRRREEVRSGRVKTIPGEEGLARVRRAFGQ